MTTHISGTVRFQPDAPSQEEPATMGRVEISLSGNGLQRTAKTTPDGKYSFADIAPGEYIIDASDPDYYTAFGPDRVKLLDNGCAEANLVLGIDRRVQGIVQDSDGKPVSGVKVQMSSIAPEKDGNLS